MMYWIEDVVQTPQRLPIDKLYIAITSNLANAYYKLLMYRVSGYGDTICKWDTMLDSVKVNEWIEINKEDFLHVSKGTYEWFYDVQMKIKTESFEVEFGIHDSLALYINTSEAFVEEVVKKFEKVSIPQQQYVHYYG